MANNTTLRDGNGALFTAESIDVGSGLQRTSTAANIRVGNADVATTNPVPIAESLGAAITGATIPAGGVGMTGWLSAIWSKIGSSVTTALGTAQRVTLVDPATGNGSLVQAFHNSDNQTIGATSYGLMTGGVDQLINASGNLDRKRGVAGDAMPMTGLAAEVPMVFNGSTYDRLYGDRTNGAWVNLKNASLPLPTGAAADAHLTNVQSAPGASATTAITIQGASGGVGVPVTGTFWPATQPVSLASLPALAAGTSTIGAVTSANPGTIASGQQTATTSAAALPNLTLVNGVTLQALTTNSGVIYVGPSGVTAATGYPLNAGQTLPVAVTNLNAVFIVGSNTADKLAWGGN